MIEGLENKTVSAPREHKFTMQSVGGQILAVFTETTSGNFQFSSARHWLWTPLPQSKYSVFVNYLFGPSPKVIAAVQAVEAPVALLSFYCIFACLCCFVLYAVRASTFFNTNDVQNRLCEGKLGSVFIYMSYLHIWFGARESVSAVWVFV